MDATQSRSRLLLVDGDPKSLRVLDVSLKKAGFDVTTATSGREALALLETAAPDLIISDTDLDEMDGFELCSRIKARPEWSKIPFLFVSARKSIEDKIRGLELGVEDYLSKPIYIKEIGIRVRTALQRAERERMESRREGRTRFAGDLSDVGVVDLVQTIELNRKSGIIHIVNRDNRRGSIFFREGKVIDAEVGRLSGANALFRLFSWSEGQFAVEFKQIRRHDVIDTPMAPLLMEGMRRLDETAHLLEKLPSARAVLEVDCRVLAEELAELPDEMNSVLRLCDGTRTLQEVIEDSDQPDLEALTIVAKLFAGQIVFAREVPDRGGESQAGERLERWLSEGEAEDGVAAEDRGGQSEFAAPAEIADVLPSWTPVPTNTLNLPAVMEQAPAADPSHAKTRSGDTLKGVPLETLFADDAKPSAPESSSSDRDAGPASQLPASDARSRKPPGLAERMLSDDSAVRASAMHEAISEGGGRITGRLPSDRNTREYGSPEETAAALVDDVVSGAHEIKRDYKLPAEPERPSKVVDWGAWPASSSDKVAPPDPGVCALPEAPAASDAPLPASADVAPEPAPTRVTSPGIPEPPPTPAATETHAPGPTQDEATDSRPVPAKSAGEAASPPTDSATASGPTRPSASADRSPATIGVAATSASYRRLGLLAVAAFLIGAVGFLLFFGRGPSSSQEALPPSEPQPAAPPTEVKPPALQPAPAASPLGAKTASEATAGTPSPRSRPAPPQVASPSPAQPAKPLPGPPAPLPVATAPAELHRKCVEVDADGKGKAKAVDSACRLALAGNPSDVDVMLILARAELDRGRLGEARSLAKKVLATDANRLEGYIYLGNVEQEAGKIEEARAAYEKYLELSPSGPFAKELRAILNNL